MLPAHDVFPISQFSQAAVHDAKL